MFEYVSMDFNPHIIRFNLSTQFTKLILILYTVQCFLYTVQCVLDTVQCVLYTVQCFLYTIQCVLYIIQFVLYTVHCFLYFGHAVHYTMLESYCVMYIVHRNSQNGLSVHKLHINNVFGKLQNKSCTDASCNMYRCKLYSKVNEEK